VAGDGGARRREAGGGVRQVAAVVEGALEQRPRALHHPPLASLRADDRRRLRLPGTVIAAVTSAAAWTMGTGQRREGTVPSPPCFPRYDIVLSVEGGSYSSTSWLPLGVQRMGEGEGIAMAKDSTHSELRNAGHQTCLDSKRIR
jgi:hypothetical protein